MGDRRLRGDAVAEVEDVRPAAERRDARVCVIQHASGSDVERYAALLQTGMYTSVYLAVGLGRYLES